MKKLLQMILVSLIPLASMGALVVGNGNGATNITSSTAWITASVTTTGAANPSLYSYWGSADGSTNASSWLHTNAYGVVTQGNYSSQITGLSPSTIYYFRSFATNGAETNWAAYSAMFMTLNNSTSAPVPSTRAVSVDTTGLLKNPSGATFFGVNSQALIAAIGWYQDTNTAASVLSALNAHIALNGTNVHGDGTMALESTNSYYKTNSFGSAAFVSTNQFMPAGAGANTYRYFARTNVSETVEVNASAQGITVARTNSVFYWNIPAGKHVFSWKIRVDGSLTDGGKIYFAWGTNDVNNSSVALGWNTTVDGFREDWNAKINPTALPSIADPTQTVISGLPTTPGTISQIHGGL